MTPTPPDADALAAAPPPGPAFEALPRLAAAEADYFCEKCGYNLRGQAVRRDPATAVLMMRCPECGTFHPAVGAASAARLWVARWARAMLIVWIFVAYSGIGVIIIAHSGILEMALRSLHRAHMRNTPDPQLILEARLFGAGASLGLGLVAAVICVIVFPHWKKWSVALASAAWPAIAAVATLSYLGRLPSPPGGHVFDPTGSAIAFAFAFFVGGLIGAVVGRPLARLAVSVVVPPQARKALTHLWGQIREA